MLKLKHINKTFYPGTLDETVLFQDFNLNIQKNDFISVIGSNGSGKSTLLNLICGSLFPDSGQILLNDRDVTREKDFKRAAYIARVCQDPGKGSLSSFSILETMALADNKGKSYGFHRGINKNRIDFYKTQLEQLHLGLENRLNDRVKNLSGGQRQALAIITATLTPHELLILDEHTAALDPKTAENLMVLTDEIIKKKGLTAIMVTHNLKFALQYGNRLLMMHQGEPVLDWSGKEKEMTELNEVLNKFNEISIESGN